MLLVYSCPVTGNSRNGNVDVYVDGDDVWYDGHQNPSPSNDGCDGDEYAIMVVVIKATFGVIKYIGQTVGIRQNDSEYRTETSAESKVVYFRRGFVCPIV
ncbi:hypothetical protein ANN_03039 [Periplaneta americana]|uniref:Uncharacterized protein n=1 Tax=Periplaneta americana TaxID=6978 RepID=A0ABQ8TY37_PERAM|nr:hypothetical protein ANN_03039 [Periplaneta americana]